ncbi:hypothetical protein [Plantactinospora sp. CA-290183]|uniref:hypothetical protein n=1 Tax=Plantactinospora sp. CA-290183 TaxID=3240006 RepID=UPI003D948027
MNLIKETVLFRWQFCGGADEDSADEVRAWAGAHGDVCLAVALRSPDGGWHLGSGDVWSPDLSEMDLRFSSARAAIEHLAEANAVALVQAVCRCGTPADCD